MSPFARLIALPVHAYRLIFSPWVGFNCRYQPTCSAYALEALEKHGAIKGTWLAARRIGRCHPFGGDGYDPVPDKNAHPPRTTGQLIGYFFSKKMVTSPSVTPKRLM
jgi:putative membrane protein insertion efficiency factor